MSAVKNALLSGFVLLICLLLIETYLGWRFEAAHEELAEKYTDRELCTRVSAKPLLIYEYIPSKCGANTRGYIDVEHELSKSPGIYRIVLIGDSVAQGQGVSLEDGFGKRLEASLTKIDGNRKYEIVILARSGYSTSQELVLLRDEAFNYNPDLIIWSYVLNDPAHPLFHNANGELGRYFYTPTSHGLHALKKSIFSISERIRSRKCDSEYHARLHCIYTREVIRNINTIGALAREHAVPVLFLVHPVFEQEGDFAEYSLHDIHSMLIATGRDAGLYPVDLLEAYRNYTASMLHQEDYIDGWWDPWHPNRLGHLLIAQHLAPLVLSGFQPTNQID